MLMADVEDIEREKPVSPVARKLRSIPHSSDYEPLAKKSEWKGHVLEIYRTFVQSEFVPEKSEFVFFFFCPMFLISYLSLFFRWGLC